MKELIAPSDWSDMPLWFRGNKWLIFNQELIFVKILSNIIFQIQDDMDIKSPNQKPMAATQNYIWGEDVVKSAQCQYKEVLKIITTFSGVDAQQANEVLGNFKNEYKDYLTFFEEGS